MLLIQALRFSGHAALHFEGLEPAFPSWQRLGLGALL